MEALIFVFIFVLGISLGSFVTLASYRLPRDEDIVFTPSRCPACGTRLKVRDLVPVFSWLAAKGSCRHCKARVHWRYPVIELMMALALLLVYLRAGLTWDGLLLALLAAGLLVLIVADFEHYMIPDEVHWLLLPLGLGYRVMAGAEWLDILSGVLLGLGLGLLLHYGYSALRKKTMLGLGDVKFLAVAGAWLGVMPFVPFLCFAGVLGVLTGIFWRLKHKPGAFPFGPALAAALFICVLYPEAGDAFWRLYS